MAMRNDNLASDLLILHNEIKALNQRKEELLKKLIQEFSQRCNVPKAHYGALIQLEREHPGIVKNMALAIEMLKQKGIEVKKVSRDLWSKSFYIETRNADNPNQLDVEIKKRLSTPRQHWYIV